jgi:hypothetical protein
MNASRVTSSRRSRRCRSVHQRNLPKLGKASKAFCCAGENSIAGSVALIRLKPEKDRNAKSTVVVLQASGAE